MEDTGLNDGLEQSVIPAATPEANQANESHDTTDSTQSIIAEPPKWKAQLPDDLKGNKDLDRYENIGALAKAVLESNGSKGELAVPGDDDAEAWGTLYNKLGRPDKSEDYQLDESINADVANQMRELAHDMGLNQKQLDKLSGVIKDSNEHQALVDEASYKGTAKETETTLHAEFGDKMEAKMEYMKRGAEKLLPPALRKILGRYNQLNNPELIRACIAYGEATADDVSTPGTQNKGASGGWDYPDA